MDDAPAFAGVTIQLAVPDIVAGLEFYTKLFGKPPDFEPNEDFKELTLTPGATFQLGQGEPRPAHTMRFRVDDFDAAMTRAERDLGVKCSRVRRIVDLVMLCDFTDPWGHRLGFYWPYPGKHRVPGGKFREEPTYTPPLP